jgi:glycosyltransferase involved in cell wall biosynthesis
MDKLKLAEMKVIAVIPVFGRNPLVKITIERLLKVNGCAQVVCVGSGRKDKETCEAAGAVWVEHPNTPLGRKWNIGFFKARELGADAVLFVGSSDWVSENWIQKSLPHLNDYGMTGSAGCHFIDFRMDDTRLVYWAGYKHGTPKSKRAAERFGEPIGIGRMLSAECLDAIGWKPFDNSQERSLDWTMYQKVVNAGLKVKLIDDDTMHALSISCEKWPNKHRFEDHWTNKLPSMKIITFDDWMNHQFPEHNTLKQNIFNP